MISADNNACLALEGRLGILDGTPSKNIKVVGQSGELKVNLKEGSCKPLTFCYQEYSYCQVKSKNVVEQFSQSFVLLFVLL